MDTVKTGLPAAGRGLRYRPLLRPLIFGGLAALGLLVFYLGIITLAQGWGHAIAQLADDRWFVSAIIAGFGTQVGLYTYLRSIHTQCNGWQRCCQHRSQYRGDAGLLCASPDRRVCDLRAIGCGDLPQCLQDATTVAGHSDESVRHRLPAVENPSAAEIRVTHEKFFVMRSAHSHEKSFREEMEDQ